MFAVSLFSVRFVQTPRQIVILEEYMGVFRIVPLNAEHPGDLDPAYLGNSVGRWEGGTLVVDMVGFKEMLHAAGGGGRSHSDALHLIERFTRTSYDMIDYNAIWDDPKMLTKPFHYSLYQRSAALAASRGASVEQFIVEAVAKEVQGHLESGRLGQIDGREVELPVIRSLHPGTMDLSHFDFDDLLA